MFLAPLHAFSASRLACCLLTQLVCHSAGLHLHLYYHNWLLESVKHIVGSALTRRLTVAEDMHIPVMMHCF